MFCPKKKDRQGKRFGFVRFPKIYDPREILFELNNIWMGSFKLKVFIPKFGREDTQIQSSSLVHPMTFLEISGVRKKYLIC